MWNFVLFITCKGLNVRYCISYHSNWVRSKWKVAPFCFISNKRVFSFCISFLYFRFLYRKKKKKNCCQGIFCCSSCYNGSQNNSGWSPLQSPAKSWLSYEIRLGCLGIYSLRSWKYLRIFYVGYSNWQFMVNIWKFLSCTHIQWLLWL